MGSPPVGRATFVRLRDGLDGGERFAAEVQRLVDRYGDPGAGQTAELRVTLATDREDVSSAARVAALGLVAFAAVAALAGLVTLTQALGREMTRRSEENAVWAALGLPSRERAIALAGPLLLSAVVGTVCAVAPGGRGVAAQPDRRGQDLRAEPGPRAQRRAARARRGRLAGAVHPAARARGPARRAADRARARARSRDHASVMTEPVMRANLPVPVAVGLRMAVEQRVGRRIHLARTPVVTAALAIGAVVAALAFSASLVRLVTEPARYGWEGDGTIEVPAEAADAERRADRRGPRVEAATLVNSEQGIVGGQRTTVYGLEPLRGSLGFTTLSGRPPAAPDETVLGPRLADELGVGVGDAVRLSVGILRRARG